MPLRLGKINTPFYCCTQKSRFASTLLFTFCKSTVPILFFHKCVGKFIYVRKFILSDVYTVQGGRRTRMAPLPALGHWQKHLKLRLTHFLHRYKDIPEDIFSIQFSLKLGTYCIKNIYFTHSFSPFFKSCNKL